MKKEGREGMKTRFSRQYEAEADMIEAVGRNAGLKKDRRPDAPTNPDGEVAWAEAHEEVCWNEEGIRPAQGWSMAISILPDGISQVIAMK